MRNGRSITLIAAALPLVVVAPLAAQAASVGHAGVAKGRNVVAQRVLASGVTYTKLRFPSKKYPEVVNVVTVAPTASVQPFVSLSNDQVAETVHSMRPEPTSAACLRMGCVAGVNGDFFCTSAHCPADIYEPEGGVVSDGRMLRSPGSIGWQEQQLTFDAGGCPVTPGPLVWTGALTDGSTTLTLDGVNVDRHSGQAVLYDAAYGSQTPAATTGVELVLQLADPNWSGELSSTPVSATAVTLLSKQGSYPLQPGSGLVAISASGDPAKLLKSVWAARSAGQPMTLALNTDSPVSDSIGAKPLLVSDGQYTGQWDDTSDVARTMFAWKPDCTRMLITVDGPSSVSRGMTMAQEAALAIALGATTAFGLDGGHSTTLVGAQGKVLNKPSYAGAGGRPTGSSLLFIP